MFVVRESKENTYINKYNAPSNHIYVLYVCVCVNSIEYNNRTATAVVGADSASNASVFFFQPSFSHRYQSALL